jgi:hypothetical protein
MNRQSRLTDEIDKRRAYELHQEGEALSVAGDVTPAGARAGRYSVG